MVPFNIYIRAYSENKLSDFIKELEWVSCSIGIQPSGTSKRNCVVPFHPPKDGG